MRCKNNHTKGNRVKLFEALLSDLGKELFKNDDDEDEDESEDEEQKDNPEVIEASGSGNMRFPPKSHRMAIKSPVLSSTTANTKRLNQDILNRGVDSRKSKFAGESLPSLKSPQPTARRHFNDASIISSIKDGRNNSSHNERIEKTADFSKITKRHLQKSAMRGSMVDSIRKIQPNFSKHKSISRHVSQKDMMIKRDIVKYFARIKQSTPSYYYFKKRDPGVMKYIFKEHSGKFGPFGDLRLYFGNFKNFKNQQLSCIKEINKNLLVMLVKDHLARILKKRLLNKSMVSDDDSIERHILDYHRAFKSITGTKKYDIDSFIDRNSYFSKSPEEIRIL